ncbi:MAG: radical SAM protein [Acidobacteria bacterium]|nr:radical SAM protein [Acidobacteriota bacterium]
MKTLFSRLLDHPLALVPPDLEGSREGRTLLVWGNVPHWMVVDGEMRDYLFALDGSGTAGEALGARPGSTRRAVAGVLRTLMRLGIVREPAGRGRRAEREPDFPPRIENAAWNVTAACNLRCRMCYFQADDPEAMGPELEADEVLRVLDGARPFLVRCPWLFLLGGEPLLRPERVLTVAEGCRKRGIRAQVSTNGHRVTPAFADGARTAGLEVQVSLDGPDAALHDALRGEGSFARAVEAVRTLARHRVRVLVSMVCTADNLPHLERYFELARDLGAREARFIPLKHMGRAPEAAVREAPLPEAVRAAAGLFRRRKDLAGLAGRDLFSILAHTCRQSVRRESCGTGSQTFLLDADGSLYPCLNTRHLSMRLGNVREPGFDFARWWRASEGLARHRGKTRFAALDASCASCAVRHWCLAGCRGEAFACTGSLAAPPPGCAGHREAVLEMFWTLAGSPGLPGGPGQSC